MNPYTGEIGSLSEIRDLLTVQGRDPRDVVELSGSEEQIRSISAAVIAERRRAAKSARRSRKRNRL